MKIGSIAVSMAIITMSIATPGIAQLVPRPPYPAAWPNVLIPVPRFADYAEFFAHVAKVCRLPTSESPLVAQQLEARSTIDRLRDYSGEPIVVVTLDLDSADGNYSFYVLRETSRGLRLLGEMAGRGYHVTIERGHLDFMLKVSGHDAQATPPRYQVDGDFLVNLADLDALARGVPIEPDWKTAFQALSRG